MTNQIQFAVALDNQWDHLCDECHRQLVIDSDKNYVGFVYATDFLTEDIPSIINKLRLDTGVHDWVGTIGIGIVAGNTEIYDTRALTILLAEMDTADYRIFASNATGLDQFVQENEAWLDHAGNLFGVIHGNPQISETTMVLHDLRATFPGSFFVGGLSSSHTGGAPTSYPQVAVLANNHPVSGILFNQNVAVHSSLTQGCTPIGKKHTVTDCKRNFIRSINDQPALDVFKQDIGEVLSRDLQKVGGYIFAGLPVAGDADSIRIGEYKVRNLMGIDTQNNTIIIGDEVRPGQTIQFCKRDNQSAWQDHLATLQALKEKLTGPIKGGLYYSCIGRGRALFGDQSQELQLIQDELGDFPLAGFFANGEIARHELYGYTGVLTLFT